MKMTVCSSKHGIFEDDIVYIRVDDLMVDTENGRLVIKKDIVGAGVVTMDVENMISHYVQLMADKWGINEAHRKVLSDKIG